MARSAVLRAASVLVLLGAISACNDQEKSTSKVLVKVNGGDITARQLEAELWSAAPVPAVASRPAVRKQALEALIDRQVLLDEALRNKVDRDPKVREVVERFKTQAIVQAYLESKAANLTTATNAEISAYYNAHPDLFAHRKIFDVTQLSVASKDFTNLLKAKMDGAKSLNQVVPWLEQRHIAYVETQRSYTGAELPPEMVAKLQRLDRNRLFVMQDPEVGQDQLCVLTGMRDSPVTQEAAAAQIERYLLNQKMQQVATGEIARLRSSAKLDYVDLPGTLVVEEDAAALPLPGKSAAAAEVPAR